MEQQEIYTVGDIQAIPDKTLQDELAAIAHALDCDPGDIYGTNLIIASIARSLARIEAQGRQGGY